VVATEKKVRIRNPMPLGMLVGPGLLVASSMIPEMEEYQTCEVSFQLVRGSRAVVGYADMDHKTMENALRVLTCVGESYEVRRESGLRELYVGDFGVFLPSDKDAVLVVVKT
jgi:hypothetical protein